MSHSSAIFELVAGVAAIIFAFVAGEFYPGMIGTPKRNPLPKWLGRFVFVAGGSVFIYWAIRYGFLRS